MSTWTARLRLAAAAGLVFVLAKAKLEPHGPVLARPAELELDYRSCPQPPPWVDVLIAG